MTAIAEALAGKFGGTEREDLAQELKILGWVERKRGNHPRAIKQRMRWYAIDYYRKERTRRGHIWSIEALPGPEPATEWIGQTYQEFVDTFLGEIPELLQKVYFLMAHEYTSREIACILNVSKGSVYRMSLEAIREFPQGTF